MRPAHLTYLVDPLTKEPLKLANDRAMGQHVMEGMLHSSTNTYRISGGIPRLLPPSVQPAAFEKHQRLTADSFAYEWNVIYRENPYEKQNFLHFLHPYVTEQNLAGKVLLDVGCGSGRFAKQAAFCGARAVIGTDLGYSVEAAFALTKDLSNVCIVQADLYHMPIQQQADLTFSIGVLHHLPDPLAGFKQLPDTVRPGGQLLIWVYNRRHNFRAVYIFETMRKISRYIPKPILFKLCYLPALGVQSLNYLTNALRLAGASKLPKKIPFSYYANFPFSMKLSDAFDVFATPYSNYYYVEEVRAWLTESHLLDIQCFEHPEAGITCTAQIPSLNLR